MQYIYKAEMLLKMLTSVTIQLYIYVLKKNLHLLYMYFWDIFNFNFSFYILSTKKIFYMYYNFLCY
jgi:hypothetical protein